MRKWIEFVFDNASRLWEKDIASHNPLVVDLAMEDIRINYKVRGYIYLNRIYEAFGLNWDPYNENICWIRERDGDSLYILTKWDAGHHFCRILIEMPVD